MKRAIASKCIRMIIALFSILPARAQSELGRDRSETCNGPIYQTKDLTHRATITFRPMPTMTQEALVHEVHGRVVLEAVLCRTGRVTDLRVIESLLYGMTEKAVEAVG